MKRHHWMLVAAFCATACGLFPSLSDLVGNDAGSPDASADAAFDAASLDAGTGDATSNDAAVLSDARFCERSDATFCDDFDFSTITVMWNSVNPAPAGIGNDAIIKNDPSDAALSPPRTLSAEFFGGFDASSRSATVGKAFAAPATHFELSFALRFDVMDTVANAQVRILELLSNDDATGNSFHRLMLVSSGSNDGTTFTNVAYGVKSADGGQTYSGGDLSTSPKIGTWGVFTLVIDTPDGGAASLVVKLDGIPVRIDTLPAGWTLGAKKTVTLGNLFSFSSSGAWKTRFDNVEVRSW